MCLLFFVVLLFVIIVVFVFGQVLLLLMLVLGDGVEDVRLKWLFYDSDECDLKLSLFLVIFCGDMCYVDQFGEYLIDVCIVIEKCNVEVDMVVLKVIDCVKLMWIDQIVYDVFFNGLQIVFKGFVLVILDVQWLLLMSYFGGFQIFYFDFVSGKGVVLFKMVVDYENNLKCNVVYVVLYDCVIVLFWEGMVKGVMQFKLVV